MAELNFTKLVRSRFRSVIVIIILVTVTILGINWADFKNIHLMMYRNSSDTVLSTFYYNNTLITLSKLEKINGTPATLKLKKILFWTPFFSSNDYYFGLGVQPFIRQCTPHDDLVFQSCETTSDRRQLMSSDAVIFHIRNINFNDMPTQRSPNQLWVFFLMESPLYTFLGEAQQHLLDGIFNWTMTYRQDSDVFNGYFKTIKKQYPLSLSDDELIANVKPSDRRLVAWLVSNCGASSGRELFVKKLKQFLPVDIYGSCGKKCPGNSSDECLQFVFSNYKFYLAFENSLCLDYVTEKFSRALIGGSVPIVYGSADYNVVAPPKSFINVKDFISPKHLADYILKLNSSNELYIKYFKWTGQFEVIPTRAFCKLCRKLHNPGVQTNKVYRHMRQWWYVDGNCSKAIN